MTRARSNATANAAKGNLVAGSGTDTSYALPVGTDGQVLTADSAANIMGIKWATASGGGGDSLTVLETHTVDSGYSWTSASMSTAYKNIIINIANLNFAFGDGQPTITFYDSNNTIIPMYNDTYLPLTGTSTVGGGGQNFWQVTLPMYSSTALSYRLALTNGSFYEPMVGGQINFPYCNMTTNGQIIDHFTIDYGNEPVAGEIVIWGQK